MAEADNISKEQEIEKPEAPKPLRADIQANHLKQMVSVMGSLVDEAKIDVKPTGLSIRVVDPAHIAMATIDVPAKAFKRYNAGEYPLGISVNKFHHFLRLTQGNQMVNMKCDMANHKIILGTADIYERLLWNDPLGMPDPKVPTLNLPAKIVFVPGKLKTILRVMEEISDHCCLEVKEKRFTISVEDDDYMQHIVPGASVSYLEGKEHHARSLFPLEYLRFLVDTIPSDAEVVFKLGIDYPVQIEFTIMDGKAKVAYLLAPRIENKND